MKIPLILTDGNTNATGNVEHLLKVETRLLTLLDSDEFSVVPTIEVDRNKNEFVVHEYSPIFRKGYNHPKEYQRVLLQHLQYPNE